MCWSALRSCLPAACAYVMSGNCSVTVGALLYLCHELLGIAKVCKVSFTSKIATKLLTCSLVNGHVRM